MNLLLSGVNSSRSLAQSNIVDEIAREGPELSLDESQEADCTSGNKPHQNLKICLN